MKNKKTAALLLIAIVIIALTGCEGMTKTTDNVGIDLSAVLSRAVNENVETAKVWLVAENTGNFVDLEQSEFDISTNETITLENIEIGLQHRIFISLGTGSGDDFIAVQTANGIIVVSGADDTATINAAGLKTVNASLTDKNIKGVLYSGSVTYAIDDGHLYYGGNTVSAGPGWTFNDLDLGINDDLFISANAVNGEAIVMFDVDGSTLDSSYSAALPENEGISAPINILSSEVFYTDDNLYQIIISQIDAGFIINMYDAAEDENTWIPLDLSELLSSEDGEDSIGITLEGELIKGLAIIEKDEDTVWAYLSTKVGNFRKVVSWDDEVSEDFGQDFITDSPELGDRDINTIDYIKRDTIDYLFIGTDSGLYSATIPDAESVFPIENVTQIAATAGYDVQIIAAGETYTACATALDLVIVKGTETASVAFNEGLPVDGLLNGDDGITGLEWKDADTLIISGPNGLAELEVAGLF